MGIFSSRNKITCPLCKEELDVKKAKEEGELEILGKDEKGHIHLKHVGFCGAHIVWDTLWNNTYERDLGNL